MHKFPLHELVVQELSCEEILPLRTRILRPNFPPDTLAHFPEDELPQTTHFALLTPRRQILAVATFFPRPFPQHTEHQPAAHELARDAIQLRGMAVDTAYQKQGLGRRLLDAALPQLALKFPLHTILWCRARQSAAGFYSQLGFHPVGSPFDVPDVGPHILMYRTLPPLIA